MARIETWFNQDLKKAVKVQYIDGNVFSADNNGNVVGVNVYDDGSPASLSGSVSASIIRADGATVAAVGTLSGNQVSVALPQSAYAVPGLISIVIKLTSGSDITTLGAIVSNVYQSTTDTVVDPGTIIPSVENLIAEIEAAIASIPADYSALWASLAPAYSSSSSYAVGDYVTYDGGLYRFTAPHTGTWDANHVTPITTTGEGLTKLYSGITGCTGVQQIILTPGKYIKLNDASGTVTMSGGVPAYSGNSSAGYQVGIFPCSENDVFTVSGHGGAQTRLWGFIDASGNILSVADANAETNHLILQAPQNAAWIIIHTNDGKPSYKGVNLAPMADYATVDIIKYLPHPNYSSGGLTMTWSGDACAINGSKSSGAYSFLIRYDMDKPPVQIKAGKQYYLQISQIVDGADIRLYWLHSDSSVTNESYTSNSVITAPADFIGVSILIHAFANVTFNNDVVEFHLFPVSAHGEYIESEIDDIRSVIAENLPANILTQFGDFSNKTHNGITYTWAADHETCVVNGTATALSYDFLWWYYDGLPEEIKPGQQYQIVFSESIESSGVSVYVYYLHIDETVTSVSYAGNAYITIPDDCIGISIRLSVPNGTTLNNVSITLKLMTLGVIATDSGVANHEAHMLSVGSSFMTGAVYPNGVFSHLASFDNSPYGNVAIGLGIEQKNVQHILMSSTGLLYVAKVERGNILDKIKSMDLSGFDYVLTQYNRPDLGTGANPGFPLGDLTSTAGDGSICGAVLDLLAYMKTSNPSATLIMVGAPPSDTREEASGEHVFTFKYRNGYSIGEADLMLHRLAIREHFIFMDWEDLNLSYYYKDFCYPGNVHPETDAPLRTMGLYLARQCTYTGSLARVTAADASS